MAFMKIRDNRYVDMSYVDEVGYDQDEDGTYEVYAIRHGRYIRLDNFTHEKEAQALQKLRLIKA